MQLIDNINKRLGDDLRQHIQRGSKLSIAASSFSIYAFEALRKELGQIDELRFIFSSDRKSTRLNSSHVKISYAVFCLKKKIIQRQQEWKRRKKKQKN